MPACCNKADGTGLCQRPCNPGYHLLAFITHAVGEAGARQPLAGGKKQVWVERGWSFPEGSSTVPISILLPSFFFLLPSALLPYILCKSPLACCSMLSVTCTMDSVASFKSWPGGWTTRVSGGISLFVAEDFQPRALVECTGGRQPIVHTHPPGPDGRATTEPHRNPTFNRRGGNRECGP